MRIRLAVPDSDISADIVDHALEAVTRTNERLLADGLVPHADEAIAKGVKWHPEPPGDEHFDNALTVVKRGHGDCDDLAPYKAASLRVTGEDPDARATIIPSGPNKWHAVVLRGDGSIDDPSADAGMYEWRGKGAPVQAKLKGMNGRPTFHVTNVNGVCCARLDVPWRSSEYALSSHAVGPTKAHAVSDALAGAYLVGEASGAVHPDVLHRMHLLDQLLHGIPPELVKHACVEYLRQHGVAVTAGNIGSFFGNILKTAAHLVPIPGVATAYDVASSAADMLTSHGGGHHAAPAHAPAPSGSPGYDGHAQHGPAFGPFASPGGMPPGFSPHYGAPTYHAPHYGAPPVVVVKGY